MKSYEVQVMTNENVIAIPQYKITNYQFDGYSEAYNFAKKYKTLYDNDIVTLLEVNKTELEVNFD